MRARGERRISGVTVWDAAARPGARVGHAIESHAEIGSTNDRALEALSEPDGEGRAIVAELQRAGRGRRGRVWASPAGLNLTVSVALRPRLPASEAGRLGLAVALAVCDACQAEAPVAIKWPNDIVAADGAKVAGLLLETALIDDRLAHVVIGCGINVNWPRSSMPAELAAGASSLRDLAGHDVDRAVLLGRLLAGLEREIEALEAGISPIDRYRAASWLDGRDVVVSLGERAVEGRALGVNEQGWLVVESREGRQVLNVGEVARVRERGAVPA